MQYRFAQPDEIPAVARLVTHSFPGRSLEFWEEQLRDPPHGGGPETLLLGQISDKPVAACQLHRFTQWIGGAALPVAGVGTVTISPIHRKQGRAADLMRAGLRAAYDRGDVASVLYPFRTSFYRRLGYGIAGSVEQHLVRPSALPETEARKHTDLLETDVGRRAALDLYNQWIRTQTGQMQRTPDLWMRLCTAPDRALVGYRNASGALEGYALVWYRTEPPPAQRYLDVEELVFTSIEARRGLYGWLASLADQWEFIMLRALAAQNISDWLLDPGILPRGVVNWGLWAPGALLLHGPMFRLLKLTEAWRARGVTVNAPFAVTFEVADAEIAENAGSWTLEFADGRVEVSRAASSRAPMQLDISSLSRLFVGSLSAAAAVEAGLLTGADADGVRSLDSALAVPEPWTFDRF